MKQTSTIIEVESNPKQCKHDSLYDITVIRFNEFGKMIGSYPNRQSIYLSGTTICCAGCGKPLRQIPNNTGVQFK